MGKKSNRRTRSPHPGVVLLRRALPSGAASYRARYTDPDTGRAVYQTLEAILSTREARAAWARRLSASLARQRAALDARDAAPAPATISIDEALTSYLDTAAVRLRPKTVQTYSLAFARLTRWAALEGVTATHELTAGRLARLRDAIIRAPKYTAAKGRKRGARKASGKPRSPVSINRELRSLATLLTAWRRAELVPLSSDQIADAMRKLPTARALPAFLSPADLRKLLGAALRHDAEVFDATREEHAGVRPQGTTARYSPIAPWCAFVLLTGVRRGEALSLRWSDVDLDALDASGEKVGEIRLRAEDVKTRSARVVGFEVSPGLRKILAAMKLAGGAEGHVFGGAAPYTADLVETARARLVAEYGAPAYTWQILRSTCATYLVNAPGVYGGASALLAARQLGHSVVVAERRYAGQLRGIAREARTLEAAMQIGSQLDAVLAAVGARAPAARRATR